MPHILIVEDEARIAGFIAKGLQKRGMMATIVEDGAAAVALAESESFDAMLLDIGLPILNGWEVLAQLRQSLNMMPIVVMTALSDEQNPEKAKSLGAQDFLRKPFRFDDLLKVLARYLGE